ncbi:MAG: hypothetical protein QM731_12910 [Chitinophagaceae bacterium]
MKNKFLKGAHLSERKVRELVRFYCEDLTATQIANITGISRITVNAYFKLLRTHVARFCEHRNPFHYNNGTIAFLPIDKQAGKDVKKAFYGIFRQDGAIYTDKMMEVEPEWLYDWLKGKTEVDYEQLKQHRLHIYHGIADFNNVKLYRISDAAPIQVRGKSQIDEVDMFWGLLKSRLVKFRGLNSSTLYLHVKETEFRYNYRDDDIYELIMDILHKQPLHYSKVS